MAITKDLIDKAPSMESYWNIPKNTTCETYLSNQFGLIGFALAFAVTRCHRFRYSDSMGGDSSRDIDEFLRHVADKYFQRAPQIVLLYDESWEISDILLKLESNSKKALIMYFLPLDKRIARRIKTKPATDPLHRTLPKATAIIAFVRNEKAFENVINKTEEFPWWSPRTRLLVLVKETSLSPTKGILELFEKRKVYNGVVVTESSARESGRSGEAGADGNDADQTTDTEDSQHSDSAIQVAALDPFPAEGHPKHVFFAKWSGGKFTEISRPVFQEKIDNLQGHKMRACIFEFPPLVMWTEVKKHKFEYTGLEIQIFKELAFYNNFTIEFYELKGTERMGVDVGDGEWNGLIGEVRNGKADVGFANIFLVDGRDKAVDVTYPYDQDRGCFAVPRPEALQNWLGLILPFSWQVWACTLVLGFCTGPLFSFVTRPLHTDKSLTIGRGIFYALGALMSVQKTPKANSHSLRAFIISWLIFCWMIGLLYRVALIVSLTAVPDSYKIDTVHQLAESGLKWGGNEETLRTFQNTTDKTDRKLVKMFQPVDDVWRALDRVANKGDFAVMESSKLLQYAAKGMYYNGYKSSIHVTRECPTYYNVGFALQIGSPLLERINQMVHVMQNSGLIRHWLQALQYQALLKNPLKAQGRNSNHGLSLDHLKLLFVIMLAGYFLGFVTFVVENLLAYREKLKSQILRRAQRKEDRDERRRQRDGRIAAGEDRRKFSIASIGSIGSSIFSHTSGGRTATASRRVSAVKCRKDGSIIEEN